MFKRKVCLKGKSHHHTKKLATNQTWVALTKNQCIKVLGELAPTVIRMEERQKSYKGTVRLVIQGVSGKINRREGYMTSFHDLCLLLSNVYPGFLGPQNNA